MPSQLPGLGLWSCFDGTECGDIEQYNDTINALAVESFTCVTAADANNITNTAGGFTNPQPGDAYVDAAGCLCVYLAGDKGFVCNPPMCGRIVYDPVNKCLAIWDGSAWKSILKCETILSNTIAAKGASAHPSGTLGYNDSASPYEEFVTINGQWIPTGNLFDPGTCAYFECEDASSIFFSSQPASAADPLKPEPAPAVPTDKFSIYGFGDSLWKQSATGAPTKLLCNGDQLIPCYADDAAAEAGFLAECLPKQDGLFYFDTTLNQLKICKAGVFTETAPPPLDCVDAFLDATQAGFLTKLNIDGKLDPNFTVQYPCYDDIASFEAACPGSPIAGQRFYNKLTGRVLVYDGVFGDWRDEAEPEPMECFVAYQSSPQAVPSGALIAGTWTTRIFNTVSSTASWATLAAGQITLDGGCCYSISAQAEHYRSQRSIIRIFDVTNGVTIQNGVTTFTENGGGEADQATAYVCAELCVTANTVIEIQHISSSNVGGTQGQGLSNSGNIGVADDNHAKIEITKKRAF